MHIPHEFVITKAELPPRPTAHDNKRLFLYLYIYEIEATVALVARRFNFNGFDAYWYRFY